ncbi:MAG: response regulator [Candidatus Thorarchaeota archaeon]
MTIRVLLIDDDEHLLAVANEFLKREDTDLEIIDARSAKNALVILENEQIDVIVCDYMMPETDGLQLLEQIRKSGSSIPFIVFTGRSREEVAIRALNLGATNYMTKQGSPTSVYKELSHLIRQAASHTLVSVQLEQAVQQHRTILSSLTDGLHVIDRNYTVIIRNPALVTWLESLGIKQDILRQNLFDVFPFLPIEVNEEYETVFTTGERMITTERIQLEGKTIWTESMKIPLLIDGSIKQIVTILRDVTVYHEALGALKESEEKYRSLVEQSMQGIIILQGTPLKVAYANQRVMRALGISLEKMEEIETSDYIQFIHPEDRPKILEIFRARRRGEPVPLDFVCRFVRQDGSLMWFSSVSNQIQYQGRPAIQLALSNITKEREADAELERQKEELSEFAHLMSHDLAGSLHNIQGYCELLIDEYDSTFVEKIIEISKRMTRTIQKSVKLADAGLVIGETAEVNLGTLVDRIAASVIPPEIEFIRDNLPTIICDHEKVMQVIDNLLGNAVEHAHPSKITISYEETSGETHIVFRNNGDPIPSEERSNLFAGGISRRTRKGLGLQIVKRIVEAHGWTISLDETSETAFRITIPNTTKDSQDSNEESVSVGTEPQK